MNKHVQTCGLTAAALALLLAGGTVMANDNDPPTDRGTSTSSTGDGDRTGTADRTGTSDRTGTADRTGQAGHAGHAGDRDRSAASRGSDDTANTRDKDSDQPIDDTWITTKVKASLLADEDVAGLQVDVETVNGVVTLSGDVDSQAQIDAAKRIAAGIEGVKDVKATNLRVEGTANR